mmetsp:Transcript_21077/g.58537  ORF Transcript_21077/g.58537 Transcript_21077/m.58537 type:complete len:200 (-) Transcript_21077:241-840(-)
MLDGGLHLHGLRLLPLLVCPFCCSSSSTRGGRPLCVLGTLWCLRGLCPLLACARRSSSSGRASTRFCTLCRRPLQGRILWDGRLHSVDEEPVWHDTHLHRGASQGRVHKLLYGQLLVLQAVQVRLARGLDVLCRVLVAKPVQGLGIAHAQGIVHILHTKLRAPGVPRKLHGILNELSHAILCVWGKRFSSLMGKLADVQ